MRKFAKWLKLVRKASPFKNVFQQILDIIKTKVRINIAPAEYYLYQFYKGDKTWEEKERFIGLNGSLYWPYELNRLKFNVTLTNKYIQKCLLMGFGLPTPRLITTVGANFEIETVDSLRKFLSSCHQDIVFKPISSMGGHRVLVLTRRGKAFYMADDEYPAERIWQHVKPTLEVGFLVEKKASNNEQLNSLFPHSLNCFRVATIKLRDQNWKIVTWGLKVGSGKSVVDNIRAGGFYIFLDEKGYAKTASSKNYEERVSHHPDTGAPLSGFQLVGAEVVKDLALEASRRFGFMGTIGWDIGLTEKGPVIIEGNNLWGVVDQKVSGGHITDEIAQSLKRHTFLSRWDRTRMFPNFHRKMKAFNK